MVRLIPVYTITSRTSDYVYFDVDYHRITKWQTVTMHLALEKVFRKINPILKKLKSNVLWFPYDFLLGIATNYSTREIIKYCRLTY